MATPRGNKCVGYIAPYPFPEAQRQINAFALGCRQRYPGCVVRVVWTGAWDERPAEQAAAEYMWHVAECDIITHGTDTSSAATVYASKGGMAIGYNSDMRKQVDDLPNGTRGRLAYYGNRPLPNMAGGRRGVAGGAAALGLDLPPLRAAAARGVVGVWAERVATHGALPHTRTAEFMHPCVVTGRARGRGSQRAP